MSKDLGIYHVKSYVWNLYRNRIPKHGFNGALRTNDKEYARETKRAKQRNLIQKI